MAGERSRERRFFIGLGRAFGGAIFFALPLLILGSILGLAVYAGVLLLIGAVTRAQLSAVARRVLPG